MNSKFNYDIKRPKTIVVGLLAILMIVFVSMALLFAKVSVAAPQSSVTLASTESVYVDPGEPNTNKNGGALFISGNGIGGTSQIALIKFDLSSVSFAIHKARLNLAVVSDWDNCRFTSDGEATISLYKVDSTTWTETGVTFNSKPTRGDFLMSANLGTTVPTHVYFTDESGGNLSTYLETERTAGSGNDGIAGLWIETNTGVKQVVFEDDEGSGSICNGGGLVPSLQLASSGEPLSLRLRSLSATRALSAATITALLLIAMIIGFLVFRWRRLQS